MTLDLTEQVKELHHEKGISEELIIKTIEQALRKAYEKYYGTTENLEIRYDDEFIISMFSIKEVVKEDADDLFEIDLADAKKINKDAEIGDTMKIPCNPEEFGRIAIHSAKQIILQKLKEIQKNSVFSDLKSKQGELIIGYIQRIKNDTIYIDLGSYEGVLPKKNQADHENYQVGERLKTVVQEVRQNKQGNVSVVLSRTSPEFVKKLIELEIPEIYDKTVQIFKIVREAGYRTKIAVYSNKEEIDPVGACVGQKGARIQNIIKELEGEKIDILNYSSDPKEFIENALIPAQVERIMITDETKKKAVAIVDDSQLSFAIGKRGLNIKLANRLTDWEIDIKTLSQALELNLIEDHKEQAEQLFKELDANEILSLDISSDIKDLLIKNNIGTLEQLIDLTLEKIQKLDGFDNDKAEKLKKYIDENFEIVVEEGDTEEVTEDGEEQNGIIYYQCPNCGSNITEDETQCPNCGVEIAFEEE
ncbi:MAG TPA: transcription termination factor NusA [Spirochaetota bacterium]|nr:transcription termination factor NusA [Spirochaetota bacterium]